MKLILHIGTEKTGTTSLQHYLKSNRQMFSNNSIFIPPNIIFGDFRAYSIPFQKNITLETFKWFGVKDKIELINKFEQTKTYIKQIFKKMEKKNQVCILSSEHFSSRLLERHEINEAIDFYSNFFSEIEVVLYISNQYFFTVSTYSETIKWGGTLTFQDHVNNFDDKNPFWNSKLLIENWQKSVGKENLKIVKYEETSKFNIIENFMKLIKCDFADENFTTNANANKSLKYFGISLLQLLNEQQRTNPRKTYWATQKYLKQILPLFDDGNLYHIFSDYCESIKQQSKNINLQLKKEFNIDLDPEFKFKFDEKDLAILFLKSSKCSR